MALNSLFIPLLYFFFLHKHVVWRDTTHYTLHKYEVRSQRRLVRRCGAFQLTFIFINSSFTASWVLNYVAIFNISVTVYRQLFFSETCVCMFLLKIYRSRVLVEMRAWHCGSNWHGCRKTVYSCKRIPLSVWTKRRTR